MRDELLSRTRSFRQAGRASVRVIARVSILLLALIVMVWSGPPAQAIHDDNYFELGGMAPGGMREIPLSEFKKGDRDVPYVPRNRLGLFCAEGQRLFPMKM